jgi:phage repressor protein C with HTH and peptisase S24 domain
MITKSFENKEILPEIEGLVRDGLEVVFVPKGSSMSPFIKGGVDRVLITKAESIAEGDIILALTEQGSHVLHRVEKVDGNMLILMGDGNLIGRERCRREDVIGKAVKIIKKDREIDCQSPSHLRKAAIWRSLLPIRRYLLAIYRRLYR